MSAPLTLAAAPAAGASAAKAGPGRNDAARAAAEAFGGTLSAALAAVPANSAPSTAAPAAEVTAGQPAPADPGAGTISDARPASPALAPATAAAVAAVQAQDGSVQPGMAFAAGEPRKAEEPDGGNQEEMILAGSPATIPGTTASGLTPGAEPGAASLVPKTPAAVPGAAQAAPAGARVEASVNVPLGVDPAGETVYLAGAPSPTAASAGAPAAAPAITPAFAPALVPAPAAAAALAAPSAPALPAAPVPSGFAAQLARPVFTLASGAAGEHTMTVAVNPESLGPVTVQASISASGVRVELFAASADGREALRQILPDLKRDLAGAGLNASLDLSAGNQPGGGQDPREQLFRGRAAIAYPDGTDGTGGAGSRQPAINDQASMATAGLYGTDGSLDVMA